MAEKPGVLTTKSCNFVAKDEIWKDHVRMEIIASQKWPENWAFMKTRFSDLVGDHPQRGEKTLPPHLKLPPITPVESYITVHSSPKPVPRTTTSFIGWRSANSALALERYGGYGARPRGSLIKQLKWPPESI